MEMIMNSSIKQIKAIFLVLPLFCLIVMTSCDSNSNMLVPESEAQEPVPNLEEGASEGCPCFNQNDIVGIGDASTSVECATTVFGIALLPDNAPTITLECMNDGTMCMCSKGPDTIMINQDQYKSCFNNVLNGMIRYNEMNLKTVGCD